MPYQYLQAGENIINLSNVTHFVKRGRELEVYLVGRSEPLRALTRGAEGQDMLKWFESPSVALTGETDHVPFGISRS